MSSRNAVWKCSWPGSAVNYGTSLVTSFSWASPFLFLSPSSQTFLIVIITTCIKWVLALCQALYPRPALSHLYTSAHSHGLAHLIIPTTLGMVVLLTFFAWEEMEAQRDWITQDLFPGHLTPEPVNDHLCPLLGCIWGNGSIGMK